MCNRVRIFAISASARWCTAAIENKSSFVCVNNKLTINYKLFSNFRGQNFVWSHVSISQIPWTTENEKWLVSFRLKPSSFMQSLKLRHIWDSNVRIEWALHMWEHTRHTERLFSIFFAFCLYIYNVLWTTVNSDVGSCVISFFHLQSSCTNECFR